MHRRGRPKDQFEWPRFVRPSAAGVLSPYVESDERHQNGTCAYPAKHGSSMSTQAARRLPAEGPSLALRQGHRHLGHNTM